MKPQAFSRQLPVGATNAQLVVRRSTDSRVMQQVRLNPAVREQEMGLQGYTPGVYFCTLLVGGVAVHTNRLLVQ